MLREPLPRSTASEAPSQCADECTPASVGREQPKSTPGCGDGVGTAPCTPQSPASPPHSLHLT